MKRSKHTSLKKTPFPRKRKRRMALRDWFLDANYYEESSEDVWNDSLMFLQAK
jgi:hypothetical protein